MSNKQELCLTLEPAGYYFVDHKDLSIFWLDDVPLEQLGRNDFSDTSFGMTQFSRWLRLFGDEFQFLQAFFEENYYCHLENFPIYNELPIGAEEFLRGALIHACTGTNICADCG